MLVSVKQLKTWLICMECLVKIKNRERMMSICRARDSVENTLFKNKDIHKYVGIG